MSGVGDVGVSLYVHSSTSPFGLNPGRLTGHSIRELPALWRTGLAPESPQEDRWCEGARSWGITGLL